MTQEEEIEALQDFIDEMEAQVSHWGCVHRLEVNEAQVSHWGCCSPVACVHMTPVLS